MQFVPTSLKQLSVQSKRFFQAASMALALTAISHTAVALPEAIEVDRYLLAAGSYLEENRLDQVAVYLEKIEGLSIEPPALYHYYKAQVLRSRGGGLQERLALEEYVSAAGKTGEHYEASLVRITALEESLGNPATEKSKADDAALLAAFKHERGTASADYAEKLKNLYLKNTFNEALVEHINALLGTHAYTGKRIQSTEDIHQLAYSVSVAGGNDILVVEKDRRQTPELHTADKTSVYGQNTFLQHACDYEKAMCVIKKPDLHTEWMTVGYDEKAVKEISVALSYLIRNLQKSE